jgi:hypothetical protein
LGLSILSFVCNKWTIQTLLKIVAALVIISRIWRVKNEQYNNVRPSCTDVRAEEGLYRGLYRLNLASYQPTSAVYQVIVIEKFRNNK